MLFLSGEKTVRDASEKRGLKQDLANWSVPIRLYYVCAGIAFALFTLNRTLWKNNTPLGPISRHRYRAIVFILVAGFMMKIISERHSKGDWLRLGLALFSAALIWAVNDDEKLALTIIMVAASRDIDFRLLCKICLIELVVIAVVTVALALKGVCNTLTYYKLTPAGIPRNSLGFGHANGLGLVCLGICVLSAVVTQDMNPLVHVLISIPVFLVSLLVAYSRASFACIALAVVLVLMYRLIKVKNVKSMWFGILGAVLLVGLFGASLALTLAFDPANEALVRLDVILSRRLTLSRFYYDLYPPRLLGRDLIDLPPVDLPAGSDEPRRLLVDNAYMKILLQFGFFGTVVWIGSMLAFFVRAAKEREVNVCMALIAVYLVYGLLEPTMVMIEPNVLLVALSVLIYNRPVSDFSGARQKRLTNEKT